MPDIVNVGVNALDVRKSVLLQPYSKVVVIVDEETEFEAGNDTGLTLEVQCPWGTQEMANNILDKVRGYQYQPYDVTSAIVDPSAELGDAVNTNGVYGGLYQQDITFGHTYYSDYSAPQDEQLDHEYTYESPTERSIVRQKAWSKAEFKLTNDAISAEVSNREADSTEFRGMFAVQSQEIQARVTQTGGESSSFAWSLLANEFALYSGNKKVFTCNSTGIDVDGSIKARSGVIGNGNSVFNIGSKAIYNSKSAIGAPSADQSNGVYVGTDGIALGRYNNGTSSEPNYVDAFSVTNQGKLTARNIDVSGKITATSGYIGDGTNGFTINNTSISNGATSATSTNEGSYFGTNGINIYKDATHYFRATTGGTFVFAGGMSGLNDTEHTTGAYLSTSGIVLGGGKFKVTSSGSLTARDGFIGNGSSGFTIKDTYLYNGVSSVTGTTAGSYFGTNGINIYKDAEHFFRASTSGTLIFAGGMNGINDTEHTTGAYLSTSGIALGGGKFKVTSSGSLTARDGYIGNGTSGFTIKDTYIYNGVSSVTGTDAGSYFGTNGINVYKDATHYFRATTSGTLEFAGGMSGVNDTEHTSGAFLSTSGIALGGGKFKVTNGGSLTAKDATLTGDITAKTGRIGANSDGTTGGFVLTANKFYSDGKTSYNSDTEGVYVGTDGIGLGKNTFTVTKAGKLTASDADITGKITATSGSFSGDISGATGTFKGGLNVGSGNFVVDATDGTTTIKKGSLSIGTGFAVDTSGVLTANSGTIGGWAIKNAGGKERYIGNDAETYGYSTVALCVPNSFANDDAVFWIGSDWRDGHIPPFYVTKAGAVHASNGTFKGSITVDSINFSSGVTVHGSNITDGTINGVNKLEAGTVGSAQIGNGDAGYGIQSSNINNGAVSKPKTGGTVPQSLTNGDDSKDWIDGLPLHEVTVGTLHSVISYLETVYKYERNTAYLYTSQEVTINGQTYHFLGRKV